MEILLPFANLQRDNDLFIDYVFVVFYWLLFTLSFTLLIKIYKGKHWHTLFTCFPFSHKSCFTSNISWLQSWWDLRFVYKWKNCSLSFFYLFFFLSMGNSKSHTWVNSSHVFIKPSVLSSFFIICITFIMIAVDWFILSDVFVKKSVQFLF